MSEQFRDLGLGAKAALLHLERTYGRARLLDGQQRESLIESFGVGGNVLVLDCGDGKIATVGRRGGGLQVHDLRVLDDGCC